MCTHTYKKGIYPFSLKKQCPYLKLFKKWKVEQVEGYIPAHFSLDLPHDSMDKCIFHSQDIAWKKANHFTKYFRALLKLHEIIPDSPRIIDLREFIIIGETVKNNFISRTTNEAVKRKLRDFIGTQEQQYTELRLKNCLILKEIRLDNIICKTAFFIKDCQFNAFVVKKAVFEKSFKIMNTVFHEGWESDEALFETEIDIDNCKFENICSFEKTIFKGHVNLYGTFEQAVDFSWARFENAFNKSREDFADISGDFKWVVLFENAYFGCIADFSYSNFAREASFINTIFKEKALFNDIKVEDILQFRATVHANKLFENLVEFDIKQEDIEGQIVFENVNLHQIVQKDRERLIDWSRERDSKIEIGRGCIKYRLQTPIKILEINDNGKNLITDIAQTFTNYFSRATGISLGLEIVERNVNTIHFFYFSDENIGQIEFINRLQEQEISFWELLFKSNSNTNLAKPTNQKEEIVAFQKADAMIDLVSVFFKIGIRIAGGQWTKQQTHQLVQATNFNKQPPISPQELHINIQNNYNERRFMSITQRGETNVYIEKNKGEVNLKSD